MKEGIQAFAGTTVPLNLNLGSITTEADASSGVKTVIYGLDSQMGASSSRWVGNLKDLPVGRVGQFVPLVTNTAAGVHFLNDSQVLTGTNDAELQTVDGPVSSNSGSRSRFRLGDAWPSGAASGVPSNTSDHIHTGRAYKTDSDGVKSRNDAGNDPDSRQQLFLFGFDRDIFGASTAKTDVKFKILYRAIPGQSTIHVNVRRARLLDGDNPNAFNDWAIGSTNYKQLEGTTNTEAEIKTIEHTGGGNFWANSGVSHIGIFLQIEADDDAVTPAPGDAYIEILGILVYESDGSGGILDTDGLIELPIFQPGKSASELVANQSDTARQALLDVVESSVSRSNTEPLIDLVYTVDGHNSSADGTPYVTGLKQWRDKWTGLIGAMKPGGTNTNYADPDFLWVAPWNFGAQALRMANQNDALATAVQTGGTLDGDGFISLYWFYQGLYPDSPDLPANDPFGTAYGTLVMDDQDLTAVPPITTPGGVHPGNPATAEAIVLDAYSHYNNTGETLTLPGMGPRFGGRPIRDIRRIRRIRG